MADQKPCPVLAVVGVMYLVPLLCSTLVAFPNQSLGDLGTTGWLFILGFAGFAFFIFGTQMKLDERVLKGLIVLSGGLYGVLGYYGVFSPNAIAAGSAVYIFISVLIINGQKKAGFTGLIVAAMMLTGWALALATGFYDIFVSGASMILGLVTLGLMVISLDLGRSNIGVVAGVATLGLVVLFVFLTALLWMNYLGQVAGSVFYGAVALILFVYSLSSPMANDQ